jgi:hypothetical protein
VASGASKCCDRGMSTLRWRVRGGRRPTPEPPGRSWLGPPRGPRPARSSWAPAVCEHHSRPRRHGSRRSRRDDLGIEFHHLKVAESVPRPNTVVAGHQIQVLTRALLGRATRHPVSLVNLTMPMAGIETGQSCTNASNRRALDGFGNGLHFCWRGFHFSAQ